MEHWSESLSPPRFHCATLLPYSGLMKASQDSEFRVDWAVSALLRDSSFAAQRLLLSRGSG